MRPTVFAHALTVRRAKRRMFLAAMRLKTTTLYRRRVCFCQTDVAQFRPVSLSHHGASLAYALPRTPQCLVVPKERGTDVQRFS